MIDYLQPNLKAMKYITRIATTLFILLSTPLFVQANSFTDVPEEHIFAQTLEAIGGEIIRGYADGTAKLDQRITREEAIVMAARLAYSDEEMDACDENQIPFSGYSDWAENAICILYENGQLTGDDATGELRPQEFVNLAEINALLVRVAGIEPVNTGGNEPWFAGNIRATEELLHTSFTDFNSDATRGQFAEMLKRYQLEETDELHTTYEKLSEPLAQVDSCQELAGLVRDAAKQERYSIRGDLGGGGMFFGDVMMEDVMMMDSAVMELEEAAPSAALVKTGGGDRSFSETNIQVQGVDEADIVKTDGEHIYTAQEGVVKIIRAMAPSEMEELAHLQFDDFWPREMYLHQEGSKQYLVLAGGGKDGGFFAEPAIMDEARIWPGFGNTTHVKILDVTEPTQPATMHSFSFEGSLAASRLLVEEGKAYFITNNYYNFWGLDVNELDELKGEELLPMVQEGSGEEAKSAPALSCDDVSYLKGFYNPQSLMVTAIELESGDLESQMILGASSQTLYMSLNNLYLTQQSWDHLIYSDFAPEFDRSSTRIFKLPLSLDQKAKSAQVPGWLLNQFSLSEYDGHLRVATTEDDRWWTREDSSNGVYVMDEDMEVVGSVTGLAPGERIFSARFMGDRGYLVTFRQVDPLFALDLSDPKNPEVLGELKIPGFSNYLHPFGDDYLIGIGNDADESTGWTRGVKASLFDVSDPENLLEVDNYVFGENGSTPVSYDHKAVLFTENKLGNGEALLAFPLETWGMEPDHPECRSMSIDSCDMAKCTVIPTEPVCEAIEGGGDICTREGEMCESESFSEKQFAGAAVFGVTEEGFELKAQITHDDTDESEKEEYYYVDWRDRIYRALWIEDVLFTLSQGNVWANNLQDLDEVLGQLELSESF